MPIEAGLLSLAYNVLRDGLGLVTGRKQKRIERGIRSREKWKDPLYEYLLDIWSKGLRDEVIIRDFRRLKRYPNTDEAKGISAWFKVGLLGLYHDGVMVGLRVSSLVYEESENAWRKGSYDEAANAQQAYLIGYIPFENVESVDFDGDEYYSFPHLICHFHHDAQPYERLAYCEQKTLDGKRHFYVELEEYDVVRLTSTKFGTHKEW